MDPELKEYLDALRTDLKTAVDERVGSLEQRIQENADTSLQSHEATRKQVTALGKMVSHLWKQVKGSDPPPPPEDDSHTLPPFGGKPMDEQLTDHDLVIAAMQGQLIAVDSKVNAVRQEMVTKANLDSVKDDLSNAVSQVGEQNKLQLKAMGLRPDAQNRSVFQRFTDLMVWMVKEPEGRKYGATMLGALTSLITAMGTTYALLTGRLPLPSQGPATVELQSVPALPSAGGPAPAPAVSPSKPAPSHP